MNPYSLQNSQCYTTTRPSLNRKECPSYHCSPKRGWNPRSPPSILNNHREKPVLVKPSPILEKQRKLEQPKGKQILTNKITWFQSISPRPKKVIMKFSSPQRTFTQHYTISRYYPTDKENKCDLENRIPSLNTSNQTTLNNSPIKILEKNMKDQEVSKMNIFALLETVEENQSSPMKEQ